MLYDIDRKNEYIGSLKNDRKMRDLVYDIESYIIDSIYSLSEEEQNPVLQEQKGRSMVCDYIVDENEKSRIIAVLQPIMDKMGIPQSIKGYRMLQSCVIICVRQAINKRQYLLKDVYPMLAKEYSVSSNNAEKLCRYACSYINISRQLSDKYPVHERLTRREYEDITLKQTVDVLVKYTIKNCKFEACEEQEVKKWEKKSLMDIIYGE